MNNYMTNYNDSLISVVIPCYNSSKTIERAVISVLSQTHSNFEIIIVDDASIDRELTFELISKFNDNRIVYIQHEYNKNGSAARNTGILIASGSFVAFLDSDDEWYADHLENSLNFMANNSSVPIAFCRSNVMTKGFKDIVLPEKKIQNDENVSEYLFCSDGFIQTSGLFVETRLMKNNLFNENLIRHQDYDLVLRLASKKYKFLSLSHIGVIIHWEDNDLDKKGGTWKYSYEWALNNRELFTKKSFKCFVLKNCVLRLFIMGEKKIGLKLFFKHCLKFYSIKEWYKILSIVFFKKVIFSKI
ncbi:MAG: glycosyltransferase family 2 protein [Bacteroidetes bacterium]|nr:glycosyltransferase family 2 protein [Bacteroidota bacterium]